MSAGRYRATDQERTLGYSVVHRAVALFPAPKLIFRCPPPWEEDQLILGRPATARGSAKGAYDALSIRPVLVRVEVTHATRVLPEGVVVFHAVLRFGEREALLEEIRLGVPNLRLWVSFKPIQ